MICDSKQNDCHSAHILIYHFQFHLLHSVHLSSLYGTPSGVLAPVKSLASRQSLVLKKFSFKKCHCHILCFLLLLIHVTHALLLHCVSKKFPPLNSVTLSNLNQWSKLLHCWKGYEICYKTHMTIPTSH